MKILNSIHFGKHDEEVWGQATQSMDTNVVCLNDRAYVLVYSPMVWGERPEQSSITLRVSVSGYDMSVPISRLLDSRKPCVSIISEEPDSRESDLGEQCGQQSFDVHVNHFHQDSALTAIAFDWDGEEIAVSPKIMLRMQPLPTWELPAAFPSGRSQISNEAEQCHEWASGFLNVVAFLADASDVKRFVDGLGNWANAMQDFAVCGLQMHVFVASDININSTMAIQQSLRSDVPSAALHTLSSRWYSCFLASPSDTCNRSSTHKPLPSPWPGGEARARKAMFFGGNAYLHPALADTEALLVLDSRVRFSGAVRGSAVREMLCGEAEVGLVLAPGKRGPAVPVAERRAGSSLFQSAVRYWQARCCAEEDARGRAEEEGPEEGGGGAGRSEGEGDGGGAAEDSGECLESRGQGGDGAGGGGWLAGALERNVIVLDAEADPSELPVAEADRGACDRSRGRYAAWNRQLLLADVQLFRKRVFGCEAFRAFVRGVGAEGGVRTRGWTWGSIATLWALWRVAEGGWVDMSFAIPVEPAEVFEEAAAAFPLQRALRPVVDIFQHAPSSRGASPRDPEAGSSDVEIVAVTADAAAAAAANWSAPRGQREWTCSRLKSVAWPSCVRPLAPRIHGGYIAVLRAGFADPNSFHPAVFGTVFDSWRVFTPQPYVRPPCTWFQSRHHLIIRRFERLILASNVAYPTSMGHMLHESLPRLVWLASELPSDIPILMVTSPSVLALLDLLRGNGVPVPRSRIVHWDTHLLLYGQEGSAWQPEGCPWPGTVQSMAVVAADELYFYGEYPYAQGDHVTLSGRSSFHPPSLLRLTRRALVPASPPPAHAGHVLLMQRPPAPWGRTVLNHEELREAIAREFGAAEVHRGDEALARQQALFRGASAVVGPHGAGFSNVIFCRDSARVVEIGWRLRLSAKAHNPPASPAPRGGLHSGLQGNVGGAVDGASYAGGAKEREEAEEAEEEEEEEEAAEEWLSDIFFEVASGLGLDYWLVLAESGGQTRPMRVEAELVLQALRGDGGAPLLQGEREGEGGVPGRGEAEL